MHTERDMLSPMFSDSTDDAWSAFVFTIAFIASYAMAVQSLKIGGTFAFSDSEVGISLSHNTVPSAAEYSPPPRPNKEKQ